jgi:hypothetical protein
MREDKLQRDKREQTAEGREESTNSRGAREDKGLGQERTKEGGRERRGG